MSEPVPSPTESGGQTGHRFEEPAEVAATIPYTFLTVHRPERDAMVSALARVVGVPAGDVDVSEDSNARLDWSAAVLCDYEPLTGDLALAWDVRVSPELSPPSEGEAARRLASALGSTVFHPTAGVRPSAYWATTPEGVTTRARVLDMDPGMCGTPDENVDGPPALVVDAAESPLAQLPGARVELIREALGEE
ncbi:hypothetical protein ACGFYA_03375 [Streptomyces sp. NPDC048305]|uniref:hypothetical protein n=1 Tax=Streptomyces sp. NPDC048305 TaxID=3365532 RepID=UPI0037220A33